MKIFSKETVLFPGMRETPLNERNEISEFL